jgi:hypothetical protein
MDMTKLATIVSLILALSIASERLAEIIKGIFRYIPAIGWILGEKIHANPKRENFRKTFIQFFSVFCGITTAYLASPLLPTQIINPIEMDGWSQIVALGLLASGGSGLWNTILTYLLKSKDGVALKPEVVELSANVKRLVEERTEKLDELKVVVSMIADRKRELHQIK